MHLERNIALWFHAILYGQLMEIEELFDSDHSLID